MTTLPASDQKFKSWFKKTQTRFLFSIRESQDQLRDFRTISATSVCIEIDQVFYYYHPSNRGKDMVLSALKAIHAKNGAVDVFFEIHIIAKRAPFQKQLDGHEVVCYKRDALNDRKCNVARIHIMMKDNIAPGNQDEICNFLDD